MSQKTIFIAIMLFFAAHSFSAAKEKKLPVRLTTYQWNDIEWEIKNIRLTVYDNHGKAIESHLVNVIGEDCIPFSSELNKYHGDKLIEQRFRRWEDSGWKDLEHRVWNYSSEGNSFEMIERVNKNGIWENFQKELSYDNPIFQDDSTIIFLFICSIWKPQRKKVTQYNQKGDTAFIKEYRSSEGRWIISGKSDYKQEKGRVVKIINYLCGSSETDTREYTLIEFTYQAQGLVSSQTEKVFKEGQYQNKNQYQFLYNKDGKIREKLYLKWENEEWQGWVKKVQDYKPYREAIKRP